MIVDYTTLEREPLIATLAVLERDLFGRGSWTSTMIRQELDAPARTYLIDIVSDSAIDHSTAAQLEPCQSVDMPAIGMTVTTQKS